MAAVIGDPVTHSLSPRIMNAAFAVMELDWVYVAFGVPQGSAHAAVDGARALGIRGLSVTMPHKAAVIPALDGLTSVARELGACNCILRAPHDDALLIGDNTDGAGFLRGLRADLGVDVAGMSCVVLGAGGAGRAVVHALAGAGARSVVVVNRDADRGERAAMLAGSAGSYLPVSDGDAVQEAIVAGELLVNATPVGMDGAGPSALPVPAAALRADLVVSELVYHPAVTPLMAAARDAGARTANGLSMLVHQAAIAFEHWTDLPAPIDEMRAEVGPDLS